MKLRYHQSAENVAEWAAGSEVWDDRLGWGAVCVSGEWLQDALGNRRRFKTKVAADRAAKKHFTTRLALAKAADGLKPDTCDLCSCAMKHERLATTYMFVCDGCHAAALKQDHHPLQVGVKA